VLVKNIKDTSNSYTFNGSPSIVIFSDGIIVFDEMRVFGSSVFKMPKRRVWALDPRARG
jgi:hypothetical protein